MTEYKNIDRLFQEALKDFEMLPPKKSWNAISKQVQVEKAPKKNTFGWIKMMSIAAMLLLFFTLNIKIINRITQSESKAVVPVEKLEKGNVTETSTASSNLNKKGVKPIPDTKKTVKTILTQKKERFATIVDKKQEPTFLSLSSNPILEESKNEKQSLNEKNGRPPLSDQKESGKISVAAVFSPIYMSSFGKGSGISEKFENKEIIGAATFSYGLRVAYKVNRRLSLQSGLNMVTLSYNIEEIPLQRSLSGTLGLINNNPTTYEGMVPAIKNNQLYLEEVRGVLNQQFSYIEIPLEVKYALYDGKIGVNLIGGMSTLLLNNNDLYAKSTEEVSYLGSSDNLKSINFSGNLGFDIDYSFNKNLFFNVSPMFKIQATTFSKNTGSFLPYYIGVYTGLNYKF